MHHTGIALDSTGLLSDKNLPWFYVIPHFDTLHRGQWNVSVPHFFLNSFEYWSLAKKRNESAVKISFLWQYEPRLEISFENLRLWILWIWPWLWRWHQISGGAVWPLSRFWHRPTYADTDTIQLKGSTILFSVHIWIWSLSWVPLLVLKPGSIYFFPPRKSKSKIFFTLKLILYMPHIHISN